MAGGDAHEPFQPVRYSSSVLWLLGCVAQRRMVRIDSRQPGMRIPHNTKAQFSSSSARSGLVLFLLVAASFITACNKQRQIKIAVIPRTCGSMIWEPEHRGAQA